MGARHKKRRSMAVLGGRMRSTLLWTLLLWTTSLSCGNVLFPPALDRLAAGAVKPQGWLLRQAQIQAKGLTGGLATWKPGGPAQSKYMPGPNTGGEEQGGEYYIN